MNEKIPVTEKLPPEFKVVMAFHPKEYPDGMRAFIANGKWEADNMYYDFMPAIDCSDPIYWSPLHE